MVDDLRDLGEFGLIQRLTAGAPPAGDEVEIGVGDDCAVIDDGGAQRLLITTDLMAEDVHFLRDGDPELLGHKLLAVNLSDIAAMGGEPRQAVVSLAIPGGVETRFLDGIYAGLYRLAERHGVDLVGGDTTGSRSGLVLSLTLTGRVAPERLLTRGGARAGDRVWVSGTLGDAAAGLAGLGDDLAGPDEEFLRSRQLEPTPRIQLGQALAATGEVTAALDISDGLASDLGHLCTRSGVGAVVDVGRLPLSGPLARTMGDGDGAVTLALGGGEDYELCFTAGAGAPIAAVAIATGVPLTWIGEIVAADSPGVIWRQGDNVYDPGQMGWDHFRTEGTEGR